MAVDIERPQWHSSAACRGDERWLVDRHTTASAEELRRICRGCPTAGECLAEALALEPVVRTCGVLRAGVSGGPAWRRVEALVAELAPATPADWSAFAAWLLDDDLAEVEVVRVRREPRPGRRVTAPVRRLEPASSPLMRLWHYDTTASGQTMTRAELVAARRSA